MANLGILLIVVGIVILALQYVHIDMSWLPAALGRSVMAIAHHHSRTGVVRRRSDSAGPRRRGSVRIGAGGRSGWHSALVPGASPARGQSWAYAWALVFPAAGGLAGIIHGTLHANWRHVRDSFGGFAFGIVMFLVLGFVFESWLGFEGFGLSRIATWVPAWFCWQQVSSSSSRVLPVNAAQGVPNANSGVCEREQKWSERHGTTQGWNTTPVVPPVEKKMETITPPEPAKPDDVQPGNGQSS